MQKRPSGNISNSLRQFPDDTCRRVGHFSSSPYSGLASIDLFQTRTPTVERYNRDVNWPKAVFPVAVVELFGSALGSEIYSYNISL
jgi:hypothetical protein